MESAGFWMLASVAVVLIATGLPAFMVLIGVAVLFSGIGIATGAFGYHLLTALPFRVVGLLENDLLQALPLYVLMGALLNRLPLAGILFRTGTAMLRRTAAAPQLAAIGLGAILAPMNGSVGASVATLSRIVQPRLLERGVSPERSLAIVCVASTLGVVVPPSLVLILLADAMMRAHTEAINATGIMARAINTQDIFHGTLVPAALFLALCCVLGWWIGRHDAKPAVGAASPVTVGELIVSGVTVVFIVGLLGGVAAGYLYAVEAAAAGAVALTLFGVATGTLRAEVLAAALRDTMAVTGALFALLVAATTFTLVFRAFETDRVLADIITAMPGGAGASVVAVLLLIGISAFVLDAFEIIFVIVPLVMPPLLTRVPDAVWVSVLTLLALQASFLIPPFGYAVMMARTTMVQAVQAGALARCLLPFLGVQILVLGLTVLVPAITHLLP
jgi:tripartite ATP-independent transporter DctM subunit